MKRISKLRCIRASDYPLGDLYDPVELFPLFCCAAGEPHTEAIGQDILYCSAVEKHQQFLQDIVLPENLQEVKSLLEDLP